MFWPRFDGRGGTWSTALHRALTPAHRAPTVAHRALGPTHRVPTSAHRALDPAHPCKPAKCRFCIRATLKGRRKCYVRREHQHDLECER